MLEVETFIKNQEIKDVKRSQLVREAITELCERNLPMSKRIDIVMDALKKTSMFAHELSSTPVLKKWHKNLLLQDIKVASFILKTGFTLKETAVRKIETITKSLFDISAYLNFDSDSDREMWQNLKDKAIRLVASDLSTELTDRSWDLGNEMPFYAPVTKVITLTPDFFELQVDEVKNIVEKGWEEQISAKRGQTDILTNTVIQIHDLRGESLINYSDKRWHSCYKSDFVSTTKRQLIDSRNQRCISEIVDEKQLNSSVLYERGLCSEDPWCHLEDWVKDTDTNW